MSQVSTRTRMDMLMRFPTLLLMLYVLAAPCLLWPMYQKTSFTGFIVKFLCAEVLIFIVFGYSLRKRKKLLTILPKVSQMVGVGAPLEEMYYGCLIGIILFTLLVLIPVFINLVSLKGEHARVAMWLTLFCLLTGPGITSTLLYPLHIPVTKDAIQKKIDTTTNFMRIHSNLIILLIASLLLGTITGRVQLSIPEILFAMYCAVGDYIGCFGRHCVIIEELTRMLDSFHNDAPR